eukprot:3941198-Rhodomonas_salina.3
MTGDGEVASLSLVPRIHDAMSGTDLAYAATRQIILRSPALGFLHRKAPRPASACANRIAGPDVACASGRYCGGFADAGAVAR